MITNKDIWAKLQDIDEKLEDFNEDILLLNTLDSRIKNVLNDQDFESKMSIVGQKFNDLIGQTSDNLRRVNQMATELKGIVSMSRAALNEGKSFTQMIELPNLLKSFSHDYQRFTIDMDILKGLILHLNIYGEKNDTGRRLLGIF